MKTRIGLLIACFLLVTAVGFAWADVLVVKEGRTAILKESPEGGAPQVGDRLPAGTRVDLLGEAPRYYRVHVQQDNREGWSYQGNFETVEETAPAATDAKVLLARKDALKIVVLDVEVGDATLIFCPQEDKRRDVILIDTGEDDGDRIQAEVVSNGFDVHAKPLTLLAITHYDYDHCGAIADVVPLARVVYDHGDNMADKAKKQYLRWVQSPDVERHTMTLDFEEQFSGGVTVECVAVNQATDNDPNAAPADTSNDNPNSIALIVSYGGFDYFAGGDLTHTAERSLAKGIRNCDVYHVNHHGSRTTSSDKDFVTKLDPEVSVVSNGTQHGHPNKEVAKLLTSAPINCKFYQTNINPDKRANRTPAECVADDTYIAEDEQEEAEGATGNIAIVVDAKADRYYVVMPGLPLDKATFAIEH